MGVDGVACSGSLKWGHSIHMVMECAAVSSLLEFLRMKAHYGHQCNLFRQESSLGGKTIT